MNSLYDSKNKLSSSKTAAFFNYAWFIIRPFMFEVLHSQTKCNDIDEKRRAVIVETSYSDQEKGWFYESLYTALSTGTVELSQVCGRP
jgi:hypothetical protein